MPDHEYPATSPDKTRKIPGASSQRSGLDPHLRREPDVSSHLVQSFDEEGQMFVTAIGAVGYHLVEEGGAPILTPNA